MRGDIVRPGTMPKAPRTGDKPTMNYFAKKGNVKRPKIFRQKNAKKIQNKIFPQKNIRNGSCLAQRKFSAHIEDEFGQIFVPMVKPKFTLFQMEIKSVFLYASKTN